MSYRILQGHVLDRLRDLPDESVHCVVTSPRKPNGRFMPGTHWRKPQPFRDIEWLRREYIEKGRSASEIAIDFGVRDTAIYFWLKRHGIKTRSVSEARKLKRWGAAGKANPMHGRTGARNPHWRGGVTPARQSFYASTEWRTVKAAVRRRDKCCLMCLSIGKFEYHHIIPFSAAPLLALWIPNVCRLCIDCHKKVFRKENRYAKRLQRLVAEKEVPVR